MKIRNNKTKEEYSSPTLTVSAENYYFFYDRIGKDKNYFWCSDGWELVEIDIIDDFCKIFYEKVGESTLLKQLTKDGSFSEQQSLAMNSIIFEALSRAKQCLLKQSKVAIGQNALTQKP